MFKRCFFLIGVFLLFSTVQPAYSAEPASDESIRELLETMNIVENMEASLDTMKEAIKMNSPYILKEVKIMMNRQMDEEKVQEAAKIYMEDDFGAKRLYELYRYKHNVERMIKEVMIPVYKEHYSTAEVKELTKFYKSDLGQKSLKLKVAINTAISNKMRDIHMMALNQAKEELAVELQQKVEK